MDVYVCCYRYQEYMVIAQEREFQNTLQLRILETRKIALMREQVKCNEEVPDVYTYTCVCTCACLQWARDQLYSLILCIHVHVHVYIYMIKSMNYNSLGCEQPYIAYA